MHKELFNRAYVSTSYIEKLLIYFFVFALCLLYLGRNPILKMLKYRNSPFKVRKLW